MLTLRRFCLGSHPPGVAINLIGTGLTKAHVELCGCLSSGISRCSEERAADHDDDSLPGLTQASAMTLLTSAAVAILFTFLIAKPPLQFWSKVRSALDP